MSLTVGIVGLPNAGKSTLFNALASRRLAATAVYPFTTIEPHEAVVAVPDETLVKLSALVKPEKTTPATVTFIDIAGLVKGAAQGEGLGNQFLAKIREVDAIVHVARGFTDENVPHPHGKLNPQEDIEVVKLELELGGIVGKPTLYVLNLGESQLAQANDLFQPLQAAVGLAPVLAVAAKLEEELSDLDPSERRQYLKELGIGQTGLEKLILAAYKLLGLITFYTIKGGKETRAWSLKQGTCALEAAGVVHTDFARGFIKAEVIGVGELLALGSWRQAQERGKVRLEGRDYVVANGEVVEFKIGA